MGSLALGSGLIRGQRAKNAIQKSDAEEVLERARGGRCATGCAQDGLTDKVPSKQRPERRQGQWGKRFWQRVAGAEALRQASGDGAGWGGGLPEW